MHVLFLPSWFDTADKPWRGSFFREQARALQRYGVRAGFAFVERRSFRRMRPLALLDSHFQVVLDEDEGIPVARMKAWSIFVQTTAGALLWCALMRRLVRAYVRAHGVPDLIHGHAALWGGYAAFQVGRDLGRPYIITEHSSALLTDRLSAIKRRFAIRAYQDAKAVIAVSAVLKERVDALVGRPVSIVLPNTVDTDYFTLPPGDRPRSPFRFLAVGDLVPSKRLDLLVRAFAALLLSGARATLTIVGAGQELERLQQLAAREKAEGAIAFTGPKTRDAVRREMWRANALVLSSDFETFGFVLIEALSTGLPLIATRCGGPTEIVRSGHGYLVDPGDQGQLTSAMRLMMRRHFDAIKLRSYAVDYFGHQHVGGALHALYRDILELIPGVHDDARAVSCA
jgi:glycosyltransferase involved in cell wall biosynthesis